MSPSDSADTLTAPVVYFDGRQATAHPVRLVLTGERLHILDAASGEPIAPDHDARQLTWPERQRHGPRVLCLAVLGIGYTHGLPAVAGAVLWKLPTSVDATLGEAALAEINERWLAPSQVPPAQQDRLRDALAQALQRHAQATGEPVPAWQLHFRRSRDKVPGANAFALPGGAIVVTDELVELLNDREDVLLGVLAHEMGHVRHRHGMRQVVQSGLLGAVGGVLLGDVSSVISSVPVLLGHLAYTRDFERQADDEAIAVMQAGGIAPSVMTVLFERLQATRPTPSASPASSRPRQPRRTPWTPRLVTETGIRKYLLPPPEERQAPRLSLELRGRTSHESPVNRPTSTSLGGGPPMDTFREHGKDKGKAGDTAPPGAMSLQADLFGSSTQPAQIVELQLVDDRLVIRGQQFVQQVPARQVHWPAAVDGGTCLLELPDGTLLHCRPDPLLQTWANTVNTSRPGPLRHFQPVALALATAALVWAGLPVAAESLLPQVPHQIDRHVGQRLLDRLDTQWLQPSQLPAQDQQQWRQRLTDAVAQVCPATRLPNWSLQFRHGQGQSAGVGAFGLPDGTVVLLDDQLGRGTLNALCRELAQLQQRQGMRMLARHQPVSLLMGVAFDDFSSTVAVAWPVLAQYLPLGTAGTTTPPGANRVARR